jgi:cytoskeletal protein CcmA (bactofilin family)
MFKKKKPNGFLQATVEHFETIIGSNTEVHGRIVIDKGMRVDGKVIGNIETPPNSTVSVALGGAGQVLGDISAYRVLVAGKVEGNIYATERVELHDGAEVRGDITYGQIGIEPGAKLFGLMIAITAETVDPAAKPKK